MNKWNMNIDYWVRFSFRDNIDYCVQHSLSFISYHRRIWFSLGHAFTSKYYDRGHDIILFILEKTIIDTFFHRSIVSEKIGLCFFLRLCWLLYRGISYQVTLSLLFIVKSNVILPLVVFWTRTADAGF